MTGSSDAPWVLLACLTFSNMRKPTLPQGAGGGWGQALPDTASSSMQNEKELQDVVKQQEEKMLQLIDKSGEVTVRHGGPAELHAWGVLVQDSSQHLLSPCRG